jgi:hypothetical protein
MTCEKHTWTARDGQSYLRRELPEDVVGHCGAQPAVLEQQHGDGVLRADVDRQLVAEQRHVWEERLLVRRVADAERLVQRSR